MIPKKIHYCWFGGGDLPERDKRCIESWKKYCPDYEIVRWDESNYDYRNNEYMYQAYEAKKWGFVPDFARLDIIYQHGGIYLDTDVELIKSLDSILDNHAFMGFENSSLVSPGLGFGAEKGSAIIKYLMHGIYGERQFRNPDGTYDTTSSPQFNTLFLVRRGLELNGLMQIIDGMRIYPSDYLCPRDSITGELHITENTYSIHWFNGSWLDPEIRKMQEVRWKAISFFGTVLGKLITKPVVLFYLIKRRIRKFKESR